MNAQTVLLAAAIFAVVAAILVTEVRRRKKGGCSGCSGEGWSEPVGSGSEELPGM